MLYVKEANIDDIEKEWQFVKEMPEDENGLTNSWHGVSRAEFEEKALPEMINFSKGKNLPEGFVPETYLFLWDDDVIVGQFRIRHYLCESLRVGAGHIGYFIKREYRGKGYGTKGLALTLQVAKDIVPESDFYLRVNKNNPASLKVMQNNGGRIADENEEKYFVRIANQNGKHLLTQIPGWDRLLKRIVWRQIGDLSNKKVLDFGSGEGITACHYAKDNEVIAIEPWDEMLKNAWLDNEYRQIIGDVNRLKDYPDESFDYIICHNVLEYIDDKKSAIQELARVLKKGGKMSLVKHNRPGRVMQMAVLLDDFEKANDLLDGKNSASSKFGAIRYYDDTDITDWAPNLLLDKCLGIRTFFDLQQNQDKHSDEGWQEKMSDLEMRVSDIPEYRDIAFFHHLILSKR